MSRRDGRAADGLVDGRWPRDGPPGQLLTMEIREARRLVDDLQGVLKQMHDRDPEQEVTGMAVPVLDACVAAIKGHLSPDDPVLASIRDVISSESVLTGEPVRAADALLVVTALKARLGPEPPPMPVSVPIEGPNWFTEPF